MLDHMLSIHVRSRVFATLEDAAQFIKSVSMLYEAYVETKKIASLKVLFRGTLHASWPPTMPHDIPQIYLSSPLDTLGK